MKKGIKVLMELSLPAKLTKREKGVLASCPVLDVYSQGQTEEQALNNLAEALTAFLVSCFEAGTLDTVLKESGFRAFSGPVPVEEARKTSPKMVKVPLPFMIDQASRETPGSYETIRPANGAGGRETGRPIRPGDKAASP